MILDYLASKTICSDDLVVVSPDVGGVARARAFAKKLSDAPLAIVDKRRHGHNVAEVGSLQMRLYFTVICAQKKNLYLDCRISCVSKIKECKDPLDSYIAQDLDNLVWEVIS